ncbi:MFS transporter [Rhodococcus phenolicus]|uniref:MFS transporter n=1 Tax=Rhodococcus phenolicus TaxID=263849 RepID=UPI000A547630|nr:MFS transporter [Rhodococcus phenolicus]
MPLYGVYGLLFEDHGLSTAQISSLFAVWSIAAFVTEVPSGAWADTVPRRTLLFGSAALLTASFALWMLVPGYWGFAAGFALWGLAESMKSGTFEALLYEELSELGAQGRYANVMGYVNSAEVTCVFLATASAGPLYALGGYALVGWVSIAITVVDGLLVFTLPSAPRKVSVDSTDRSGDESFLARYAQALRDGTGEVRTDRIVRRAVLLTAVLMSFLALDEYFALLARDGGATTAQAPLLVAITVVGQVAGAAVAGRTAGMSGRVMAAVLCAAAVLIATGAVAGGIAGFVAIGVGYGALHNTTIVAEVRMQDAMSGSARATVTSVAGLTSEVASIALFAGFALGSAWLSLSILVAAVAVPLLLVAVAAPRMLPRRPRPTG